jgi:hypothetical protein
MMQPTDRSAKGFCSPAVPAVIRQNLKPHANNATYLITDTDGDGLGTLNRLRFSFSRHDVAVLEDEKWIQ